MQNKWIRWLKMKFLDTNVLAYAFYQNDHTERCQKAIFDGGVVNALNLVEAFFIIEKETSKERAQKAIKSLLKSNLKIIDLDINLIFDAMKKIDRKKLSIFDMIHYASALKNSCDVILSYDTDFDNLEIPREEP